MLDKNSTKILTWETVSPIFQFYLAVWPNQISMNFASAAWQGLVKKGMVLYSSNREEIKCRSYAVVIALIYYEYCHRAAWHENETFIYWDDHIIETFKTEFVPDYSENEDLIFKVKKCLISYFGGEELCAELWINCIESSISTVSLIKEKTIMMNELLNNGANDFNYNEGRHFMLGIEIDDLETYHSISGL